MNGGNSNFDSSAGPSPALPAEFKGCPEETLLAWIEGELSPGEVSALVERFPGAVPLIASMRRDRATLAAVATAAAPSDLAEKVLAAVEREALLGLSQGEPLSDSLPISQIPKRKTPRQVWFQQAAPRLALAAGLVLVVSAGAIFALRSGQPKGTVGPVAINDLPEVPSPVGAANTAHTAASRVASGDAAPGVAEETVASKDIALAEPGAEPAEPNMAAATLDLDAHGTIDPSQAVELAASGRLILRVRDVSTAAAARLASGRARVSPAWQVQGDLPHATLATLTPALPIRSVAPRLAFPDIAASFSSGDHGPASIHPLVLPETSPVNFGPTGPQHAGTIVDIRADAASMETARAELSKLLGKDVEFAESDQPITIEPSPATPEAVLWWTQPPQSWAKRVPVPLVVELR